METPAPTISNFNLTEEIKDIKEYKINSENESFIVKFGKTNNLEKIIFIIEDSNILTKFFCKSDFSLDELKNINKLFRIFDSINETYNEINGILSNKKIIIKRGLNELNLYLSLSSISSKIEDICLKIKKEDFNNQIVNDIIIKELNEIKKLLMEEKQKNKQLNNIVDELIQEKN